MTLPQRIHLIGIGGAGLSAIARVLLEKGHTVSGSDRQDSPLAASLQAAGAQVFTGHAAEHVHHCDLVIRSSAIPENNPEVVEAHRLGIPVLKRDVFLGELMTGKTVIAVAGSHGKTTTTAMLAWVFSALNQSPSFIVGGVVNDLGANARAGQGPHFIIEADEYDRMFHGLRPSIAVVTNVEHDHPDCYPTPEDFFEAFSIFVELIPVGGSLVYCFDDPGAVRLAQQASRAVDQVAYGLNQGIGAVTRSAGTTLICTAVNTHPNQDGGFSFDARIGSAQAHLDLRVPGMHNVRNALAVLAVAALCRLDMQAAAMALNQFSGAGRRFEVRGEAGGVTIIDDYGHHPTEIRATLAGAKARYPDHRIIAVWQPHTFSRTQTLFENFVRSFGDADQVIVTEIYASREQMPDGGYSARLLVDAINRFSAPHTSARAQNAGNPAGPAHFAADLPAAVALLLEQTRSGDVVVILSAGDANWISQQVLTSLEERKKNHV